VFIGIFILLAFGIFISGCLEEKTYTCTKDSDCVLGMRLDSCCPCPEAFHNDEINSNSNIVIYEEGKNYNELRTVECGKILCKPCAPYHLTNAVCTDSKCQTEYAQEPTPTPTPTPTIEPTPEPTQQKSKLPQPIKSALYLSMRRKRKRISQNNTAKKTRRSSQR